MTDEIPTSGPTPTSEPTADGGAGPGAAPAQGSPTADAWSDVVARMSDLGIALSAWARSAADDPQNKQRLEQVRAGVDEMARQADSAFGRVTSSDFGQQVSQGAQQAGDAIGGAAQQVSDAAAPHVATALSGLAGVFGRAAAKVDEAVNRDRAAQKPADAAAAPAPAAATQEPPEHTPPGSGGES
jgi:hypothetical protein